MLDGWMDRWMDGWMDGDMERWVSSIWIEVPGHIRGFKGVTLNPVLEDDHWKSLDRDSE